MSKESEFPQIAKGWMEMVSGAQMHFGDDPADMAKWINTDDVAWSLSMLCRYNGHTKRFYSVGEHACLMADAIYRETGDPMLALTALHHDDAEHILGDMVSPIKATMSQFQDLEDRIDESIAIRYGTLYPFPSIIKEYDARICVDERAQVMNDSHNVWWCDSFEPLGVRCWNLLGRFHWYVRWQFKRRHGQYVGMLIEDRKMRAKYESPGNVAGLG